MAQLGTEVGRNDVCPCGSGKKYKKCCIDKEKLDFHHQGRHWRKEEIDYLSTSTIISRLKYFGVEFDKKEFIDSIKNLHSADAVSESWFQEYNILASDLDEDFLWFAAWVLAERFSKEKDILCNEELSDMIQTGYSFIENDNYRTGVDIWLQAWNNIKNKTNYMDQYNAIEIFSENCNITQFIRNWVQDIEQNLYQAGRKQKEYFKKRIKFCQDTYKIFPESEELFIKNVKRSEAESYFALGDYETGDKKFKKIIEKYPHWVFGYLGWGDMYKPDSFIGSKPDQEKALEIYQMAQEVELKGMGNPKRILENRISDLN